MKVLAPSLNPIFRSDTQGRLLARLFLDTNAEFTITELSTHVGCSAPTVLREVERAELAGLLRSRKIGPSRLVRADTQHPLHDSMSTLILSTFGPPLILSQTFIGLPKSDAVIIFGSWAARFAGRPGYSPQDIDVLVIGAPETRTLHAAASAAERQIGLEVNAISRPSADWLSGEDPFISELRSNPVLPILVDEDARALRADLEQLLQMGSRQGAVEPRKINNSRSSRARRTEPG